MLKRQLSTVGCCLALAAQPALGKKLEFAPALPQCKPVGELRTPMPVWSPEVTHDGELSSAPPEGNARIVYLELMPEDDDVHCVDALDNEYYTFTFPARKAGVGIEVNIRGPARYVGFGAMCSFSGFYVSEAVEHDGQRQTTFRPVDKFGVMSSGLYCLGKWTHAAPKPRPHSAASDHSAENARLPVCKRSGEERVPIPAWTPQISGDYEDIFHEPPRGDGRIVHISISLAPGKPCTWYSHDLFSFALPSDPRHRENGGLEVNLRGNATEKGDRCVLEGFYMNERVLGIQQGWVSTYFGAVDEKKITASGTYCLEPPENDRGGSVRN